jgi:flagellar basal body-associated protein FliL
MADDANKAPKRSSRTLMMVGAAVLLLAGVGAGGAYMFLGGEEKKHEGAEGEEVADAEGEGEGHGEAPAEGGEHGGGAEKKEDGPSLTIKLPSNRAVVNLGTFTVNLRGSGGGRVLRAEVQLEVASRDSAAVEGYQPVLRDAVITLASDFTYADIEGVDGKTHLRDELLGRLNTVLDGNPSIDRVYFTEFVVQ